MFAYKVSIKNYEKFLEAIKKKHELIAPVKKGLVRFEPIKDIKDIFLEKNAYFPVKEYFFKKQEVLLKFQGIKVTQPKLESPTRVFFGLRRCDLNGIKHQDKVFMETIKDPYYIAARKNSILIGYHCEKAPSKYCFCGTLNLADFYDLIFYDRQNYFLVEVGSKKGLELVDTFSEFFEKTKIKITPKEKKIRGADRLIKKDISQLYDNKDWEKGVNACLSCAACTSLCPTCYCFEIHDEVKTSNPTESERKRTWSSCQLQSFSKVAGNHVFREKRSERFKHRIYHQLDYFKERYGVNLCTGCGRCIEGCPTRIDFVDIINKMKTSKIKNVKTKR